MSARTTLPFDSFKLRLDEALNHSFAARVLRMRCSGTTLDLDGPGCRASATFDRGNFRGQFELSGAAKLMEGRICADLFRMLRAAGCEDVRLG